jgi:hypothetical protein
MRASDAKKQATAASSACRFSTMPFSRPRSPSPPLHSPPFNQVVEASSSDDDSSSDSEGAVATPAAGKGKKEVSLKFLSSSFFLGDARGHGENVAQRSVATLVLRLARIDVFSLFTQ